MTIEKRTSPSSGGAVRLLLAEGNEFREILLGDRLVVGRGERCDLRLEGSGVSRSHAVFERSASSRGGHALRDNRSRNGVEVNGELVDGSRQLKPGDAIIIGGHLLIYAPDNSIDLDEALRRADALAQAEAERTAGEMAAPGGSFAVPELRRRVENAPLAFDSMGAERELAPGPERDRLIERRAAEPFRAALFLSLVAAKFGEIQDPAELCSRAARAVLDALGGSKALVMLRPRGATTEDEFEIGALAAAGESEMAGALIAPSAMRVLAVDESALLAPDAPAEPLLAADADALREEGVASLAGVPLFEGGDALGFLLVESRDPRRRYAMADLQSLLVFCEHLSLHLGRFL